MENSDIRDHKITDHRHSFAAWVASRASSHALTCKFKAKIGRELLEHVGFGTEITSAEHLPNADELRDIHREWRKAIVRLGKSKKFGKKNAKTCEFTHGIAAKLINMYVKSVFVCGEDYSHENLQNFHPPIDRLLLRRLAVVDRKNKERVKVWRERRDTGWTKMDSGEYEEVIDCARAFMNELSPPEKSLWKIEALWKGYQ